MSTNPIITPMGYKWAANESRPNAATIQEQPAEWDNYSPDMSGNSYIDPIEIHEPTSTARAGKPANRIHAALDWALRNGTTTVNSEYARTVYTGRLHSTTVASIIAWMTAHGGSGSSPHNCRLCAGPYDLALVAGHKHTTIELIDYTREVMA